MYFLSCVEIKTIVILLLLLTGGFRSVISQRRPDRGGLVSHLTSSEKVQIKPHCNRT